MVCVCVAGGSGEVWITNPFTAPGLSIRPLGGLRGARVTWCQGGPMHLDRTFFPPIFIHIYLFGCIRS